ncbi:PLP-dependent transferase [Candidatus Vidania fulgoroideorum]
MKDKTKLIHRKKKYNKCYMSPIFKHSSLFFKNIKHFKKCKRKKNTYGLDGNILSKELEKIVAKIEGGKYSKLTSSGLMAIFLVYFTFLKKNDTVLIPKNLYGPNLRLLKNLKEKINFNIKKYSHNSKFEKYKKIKMIFVEAPGSVTFEIPNINKICKLSKKKKSILVCDNTYSCGISFKPFNFGFDISIQALTKFYSGSNDVLMGSICTKKKKIFRKIDLIYKFIGSNISCDDCYLIIRNIHNIHDNFKIHERGSYKIAKYLCNFKFIKAVLHPKLKEFCSNKNWKIFFKGSSGLVSFFFDNKINKDKVYKFINNLKLLKLGYSWGGAISMIMFYKNFFFLKKKIPIIIRLYIGKECIKDIMNDIKQSLIKSKILK